jgi:hypothetical protein
MKGALVRPTRWLAGVCAVAVVGLLTTSSVAAPTPFFYDDFGLRSKGSPRFGAGLSWSSLWDTGNLTSGVRWCSEEAGVEDPGVWLNPAQTPCKGQSAAPPYGSAYLTGASASLAAPAGRAFPFVRAAVPSFPGSGDFRFIVRMRIDAGLSNGTGLRVYASPDSTPVNGNLPGGTQAIFQVWSEGVSVLGVPRAATPPGYHTYRLDYIAGAYTLFIDDVQIGAPITSSARPNALWIGNPIFVWWNTDDWSDFTLDRVATYVLDS